MIWITSDWHMDHAFLVTGGHRPAGYETLIRNHVLGTLKPGDTLLNLGDVAFTSAGADQAELLVKQLESTGIHTVLVRGNHDGKRMGRLARMGWSWISDETSLVYAGKRLLFTHEPDESETSGLTSEEIAALAYSTSRSGRFDFNIHGHLHDPDGHRGSLIRDGKHILISSELMDYRPIHLDHLLKIGETPVWNGQKFVGVGV